MVTFELFMELLLFVALGFVAFGVLVGLAMELTIVSYHKTRKFIHELIGD
jgi:hypothetical protein